MTGEDTRVQRISQACLSSCGPGQGAYSRLALLRLKGTESPEIHPEMQIAIRPVSGRTEILNFLASGG